jgi:hypothetical protein
MKLTQPIPVFNVDGTVNTEGSISEVEGTATTIQWPLRKGTFLCNESQKTEPHPRTHLVEGSQPGSGLEDQ